MAPFESLLQGRHGRRRQRVRYYQVTRLSWHGCFCHILYIFATRSLVVLGLIKAINLGLSTFIYFHPDEIDIIIDNWGNVGQPGEGLIHWPTDFTEGITPIQCHSHNDYWRDVPLYEAIRFGCVSVEADIWLSEDGKILVGHTRASLTPDRTLEALYVDPLTQIIDRQNPNTDLSLQPHPVFPSEDEPMLKGVFESSPNQTLVLLLDFKTVGATLWPFVQKTLFPLHEKGYLTYWDGTTLHERPLTIVASGDAPYDLISYVSVPRYIFFDAPLASFSSNDSSTAAALSDSDLPPYTAATSYYASTSFKSNIGHMWLTSHLARPQLTKVREQIKGAHAAGLKVRYWGIPTWPRGLRNHIWHVLMREGVDILNTDDLKGATLRDWRRNKGWWY